MNLSQYAIDDLRVTLHKKYGTDFSLTDEDLNEIGLFLLTALAEVLKTRQYAKMKELHRDAKVSFADKDEVMTNFPV